MHCSYVFFALTHSDDVMQNGLSNHDKSEAPLWVLPLQPHFQGSNEIKHTPGYLSKAIFQVDIHYIGIISCFLSPNSQ